MEATQEDLYGQASAEYVGRWNRLISTTNWEKGRIIRAWREELIAGSAPAGEYADEAWARRVGGVSPQHVGRLRRVSERFGEVHSEYKGLYWSHFQAAGDWDDAEMWLEGALQNDWSVSQMRQQRCEAIGAPDDLKPNDADIVVGELDEDVDPALDAVAGVIEAALGVVHDPAADEDFEDDDEPAGTKPAVSAETAEIEDAEDAAPPVRPFANLPSLPDDLSESLESFKLAIIRHRLDNWSDVSPGDVIASLDALKALVLAPAED